MTPPPLAVVRAMGDTAALVQTDALATMQAVHALVRRESAAGRLPAIQELVPAARTVLVIPERPSDLGTLLGRLETLCATVDPAIADSPATGHGRDPAAPAPPQPVLIDTYYDGPDLAEVAALTGLTVDQVIAAHTASPWRVAFCGFSPGFGYLDGGDERLQVPRRDRPRTRIPAGSVGLAGEFSGIYPRASPGGWQLIGRTDAPLWDIDRPVPALLQPGGLVQFRAIDRPAGSATGHD